MRGIPIATEPLRRPTLWWRAVVSLAAVVLLVAGLMSASVLVNPYIVPIESRVLVSFQGSIAGDGYLAGAGEHVMGALAIAGAQLPTLGILAVAGPASAVTWPVGGLGPAGTAQRVLTEIVIAPDGLDGGGTLIDVAGAARLEVVDATRLRVVAGSVAKEVNLPKASLRNGLPMQHLGLYSHLDTAGAGTVTVFNQDGALAAPIAVTGAAGSGPAVVFAKGLTGSVYGVGVSTGADTESQQLSGLPCTAVVLDAAHQVSVTTGECESLLVSKASSLRPTARQLAWQETEQSAFLHFGVNTFTGLEWGIGDEDPDVFAPTDLDTDQWARVLRDNGFRIAILTVKHHDGFLLYPSRYTDHNVASSKWLDGHGDVLKSFTESARRYGLKVGVYLSPADQNQYENGVYANGSTPESRTIPTLVDGDDRAGRDLPKFIYDATDYGAYFLNQLYEVLTQYGPIDEVWFDGAQGNIPPGSVENYDFGAYFSLTRALAPQAVIAAYGPDVRWVGNEGGLAREDEWSTIVVGQPEPGVFEVLPSIQAPALGTDAELYAAALNGNATDMWWYPAEADVSIRPGWFYHSDESAKSVADLTDIYYRSVGRNSVLLLNIPPDQTGRLSDADVARVTEWQAALRQAMPEDLALGAPATTRDTPIPAMVDGDLHTSAAAPTDGSGAVQIDLGTPARVDRVALSEDIASAGQQVRSFAVDALVGDEWQQVAASGTIGYKKILALAAPVVSGTFRIRITDVRGPVLLSAVSLYSGSVSPPARQTEYFVDCAALQPGPGTERAPMRGLAQLRSVNLPAGATVHIRTGTTCSEPLELWGYGSAEAPARLVAWGDGAAPVIVGDGNTAAVAALKYQGWVVDGVTVIDSASQQPR